MTIQELYNKIYLDDLTKNPNIFLEVYESSGLVPESMVVGADQHLHNKLMRLTADYGHVLTMNGSYRKALPILTRAIELFKTYPEFEGTNLLNQKLYEVLLYDCAVANFHTKHFQNARATISILIQAFPENIKYKNWLETIRVKQLNRTSLAMFLLTGIGFILTTFIEKQLLGHWFAFLYSLMILTLLAGILLEAIIWVKKKRLSS